MRRSLKRNDAIKRSAAIVGDDGHRQYDDARGRHAWEVVRTLVNGGTDPTQLLELYYWAREPGIVELIRAYLDLPEATQRGLGDFLLNTRPQSIVSSFDPQGRLVLSRSAAAPSDRRPRRHSGD